MPPAATTLPARPGLDQGDTRDRLARQRARALRLLGVGLILLAGWGGLRLWVERSADDLRAHGVHTSGWVLGRYYGTGVRFRGPDSIAVRYVAAGRTLDQRVYMTDASGYWIGERVPVTYDRADAARMTVGHVANESPRTYLALELFLGFGAGLSIAGAWLRFRVWRWGALLSRAPWQGLHYRSAWLKTMWGKRRVFAVEPPGTSELAVFKLSGNAGSSKLEVCDEGELELAGNVGKRAVITVAEGSSIQQVRGPRTRGERKQWLRALGLV